MKLMIIRHADPDYSIDSLTPSGWKEAELLSEYLKNQDIAAFYVSPLGRARDTASLTLKKMGRTAEECKWLREFWPRIHKPNLPEVSSSAENEDTCVWDWLPALWTKEPRFYDKDLWFTPEALKAGNTEQAFREVTQNFDQLLARHGYLREDGYYRAQNPNRDTIALFCHFGLECVLLAHLLGISPMVLWHGTCAAPSSVTTLITEERRKGIAYFRMTSFGSTEHLYTAGEKPSFAARFCETYDNKEERHD